MISESRCPSWTRIALDELLDVGDVLFMGTPAGVGAAMKPPQFLVEGDVVKIEIDKLGFIENTVVAEDAQCLVE